MVQTMESPPFDLQAYQPPISLWRLIEQYVPEHERQEIKSMLGESLIDQSLELHEEICTLLEIWRDYRDETSKAKPMTKLPEPPGLRDRLIQEIQFYVDSVKEKAKHQGVNVDKILSRHNSEILDYALDTYRPDSARPSSRSTARGNDGRETPMICSPACSDRTSDASILSEEVEAMNEKLNVLKFDEVVSHLRSTMEDETEMLLRDISFLQNCLDDEATYRAESTGAISSEPTLTDLKEERSTLEKDLLSNMSSQSSPPLRPAFTPPHVIKKLGPSLTPSSKLKSVSNHGANSVSPISTKSGPMKAFTSPEPPRSGKSSGSIRMNSAGKNTTRPTQQGSHYHLHQTSDRLKSPETNATTVVSKRTKDSGSAGSSFKQYHADIDHRKHDKHSGDNSIDLSDSRTRPRLEAVVTLSKGKTGDGTDVHVIPSPPSSAKPSTPRSGSAQRFRQMVLECRDSS